MFHKDGWAASIWTTWADDAPIDADMLAEILDALPAPSPVAAALTA
jgi:hypothetical protein